MPDPIYALTEQTATRVKTVLNKMPAQLADTGRGPRRLTTGLVECTFDQPAGISGIAAECYQAVLLQVEGDETSPTFVEKVWLTVLENGVAVTPIVGRVYHAIITDLVCIGSLGGISGASGGAIANCQYRAFAGLAANQCNPCANVPTASLGMGRAVPLTLTMSPWSGVGTSGILQNNNGNLFGFSLTDVSQQAGCNPNNGTQFIVQGTVTISGLPSGGGNVDANTQFGNFLAAGIGYGYTGGTPYNPYNLGPQGFGALYNSVGGGALAITTINIPPTPITVTNGVTTCIWVVCTAGGEFFGGGASPYTYPPTFATTGDGDNINFPSQAFLTVTQMTNTCVDGIGPACPPNDAGGSGGSGTSGSGSGGSGSGSGSGVSSPPPCCTNGEGPLVLTGVVSGLSETPANCDPGITNGSEYELIGGGQSTAWSGVIETTQVGLECNSDGTWVVIIGEGEGSGTVVSVSCANGHLNAVLDITIIESPTCTISFTLTLTG